MCIGRFRWIAYDTSRNQILDAMRGFALLSVLFGHAMAGSRGAVLFTAVYHMPVFYCISGYLYRSDKEFFRSACRVLVHLVVPYVFFWLFSIILSGSYATIRSELSLHGLMRGILYADPMVNLSLWFLPVLATVHIINLGFDNVIGRGFLQMLLFGCLCLAVHVVVQANGPYAPMHSLLLHFDAVPMGIVWFLVGRYCARLGLFDCIPKIRTIFVLGGIITTSLGLMFFVLWTDARVDLHYGLYPVWCLPVTLLGIAMTYFFAIICCRMKRLAILLCHIGAHSLVYFASEAPCGTRILSVVMACCPTNDLGLPQGALALRNVIVKLLGMFLFLPFIQQLLRLFQTRISALIVSIENDVVQKGKNRGIIK